MSRLAERLRPDTIANKVALLLSAITVVAFGASFLYVVPQLRESLAQQSLKDLSHAADRTDNRIESLMGTDVPKNRLDKRVRSVADESGARVTVLGVQRSGPDPGALLRAQRLPGGHRGEPELCSRAVRRHHRRAGGGRGPRRSGDRRPGRGATTGGRALPRNGSLSTRGLSRRSRAR